MCGVCSNYTESDIFCDRCIKVTVAAEFVETRSIRSDPVDNLLAEQDTTGEKPKKLTLEESLEKREKLYMAILLISCLFIAFRLYTTTGSGAILTPQQIQAEELAISQLALCEMVFWEIAAQLQNDQEPDASLACAENDDPNIISSVGDDIIVTHPHPELLGYSKIYIRKSNPIPIFEL